MDAIAKSAPLEVPLELRHYAKRYEQMQERKNFKGIYSKSYMELYMLLADSSITVEQKAELLFKEDSSYAKRTVSALLFSASKQFFPGVGKSKTLRLDKHARVAKQERLEKEFRKTLIFKKAKKFFAQAELKVSPVLGEGALGFLETRFLVEGVYCSFVVCKTVNLDSPAKRFRHNTKEPTAYKGGVTCEFGIWLFNIRERGSRRQMVYVIPCGEGWPAQNSNSETHLPLRPELRRGGARPKIDYEQYRDERGLALLKAAVEEHRAKQPPQP